MHQHDSNIQCPKCGHSQSYSQECIKCGIIFSKIRKDIDKQNHLNNGKISWKFYLSLIYLILVIFDTILVYDNELTRPNRERLYSTVDLIEFNIINTELYDLKRKVEDLFDRRTRLSSIIEYIKDQCYGITNGVRIIESSKSVKCIFLDNTIFSFSSSSGIATIRKRKLIYESLFSYFPNLYKLHMKYIDIDYDSEVNKLHQIYNSYDYSKIEEKYLNLSKNSSFRISLFMFLLWSMPLFIIFLIKN